VKDLIRASPLLQMGWVVAFSVLAPLGVGLLLDRRLGTAPLFIIIGALVGILTSTIAAVRMASRAIESLGQAAARGDEVGDAGDSVEPHAPVDGKEDRA
jgi:hypothetical protein